MEAATAPTCSGLCSRSSKDDHILETTANDLLDTERFCFFECTPKPTGAEGAARSGDACRSLSDFEKKAVHDASGNARPLPQQAPIQKEVSANFLARKQINAAVGVLAVEKKTAPAPAEPWSSATEPSETDSLKAEVEAKAEEAKTTAEQVQDVAFRGAATVPLAANAEEDARLAARFALSAEAAVKAVLEQAKIQAKAEAFGVLREVLPGTMQNARAVEHKAMFETKAESAQRAKIPAMAQAAQDGMQPWADAMAAAVKVRDDYASRGNDLAKASYTAEQNAGHLEQEARSWDAYPGDPAKHQADKLHKKAQDLMAVAAASDQQAQSFFKQAKYIDSTLPSYSRQAEQGAYHAMAMVAPDVPPPMPPLALMQEKMKQ